MKVNISGKNYDGFDVFLIVVGLYMVFRLVDTVWWVGKQMVVDKKTLHQILFE